MKKLTIMVSNEFYNGIRERVGPRGIGRFIENLARDHVVRKSLLDHYREASQDEEAEREAMEWVEADLGDTLSDEDWDGPSDAQK